MGKIGKLNTYDDEISEANINPGGGANQTCEHYACAGDDSVPLSGDWVSTTSTQRTGVDAVSGYKDSKNNSKAQAGEKRIYARDGSGNTIVEFWLKNNGDAVLSNESTSFEVNIDGSVKCDNGAGSFELKANGDFVVNGVTIDVTGNIMATNAEITASGTMTVPNIIASDSLLAGNKELINHTHPHGEPNTGVNN